MSHPLSPEIKALIGDSPLGTTIADAVMKAYDVGRASARQLPQVTIYAWVCPHCDGKGHWGDAGSCLHCHGFGLTNDVDGWEPDQLTPAPRPPGVMARSCADCAYRPGSPEDGSASVKLPGAESPFFCHHGLHRVGDGYSAPAMIGEMPLGAMLCASWWTIATGGAAPDKPFRDPGGACRAEAAPTLDPTDRT